MRLNLLRVPFLIGSLKGYEVKKQAIGVTLSCTAAPADEDGEEGNKGFPRLGFLLVVSVRGEFSGSQRHGLEAQVDAPKQVLVGITAG